MFKVILYIVTKLVRRSQSLRSFGLIRGSVLSLVTLALPNLVRIPFHEANVRHPHGKRRSSPQSR